MLLLAHLLRMFCATACGHDHWRVFSVFVVTYQLRDAAFMRLSSCSPWVVEGEAQALGAAVVLL